MQDFAKFINVFHCLQLIAKLVLGQPKDSYFEVFDTPSFKRLYFLREE